MKEIKDFEKKTITISMEEASKAVAEVMEKDGYRELFKEQSMLLLGFSLFAADIINRMLTMKEEKEDNE